MKASAHPGRADRPAACRLREVPAKLELAAICDLARATADAAAERILCSFAR